MGKKIQCIGRYIMDGVVLGKGNFAHVELATHGVTKVKVAIKIIDTRKIKDEYVRKNLHREARIMTALHHPNIVRLYETLKATTLYCLVTEYASGGDLLTYIKIQKDCRLPEGIARPFIRQLVSAIHYLHERNVVHRDLKMENIMLEEKQKSIKLIDFGLSNTYIENDRLKTHCGSPEYAAPELFVVGRTYGPEIDIWSLGIITYAMVLGRLPFFTPYHDEYHRQRMLQQIQKGLCAIHDREMHTLSADCRNLLHQLVEPNPELRIPLPEIELHQWLTKNGKHPFSPYITPMRNKNLRSQIVAELAELMDMKKGVVNETVKETRADELSAMFNMMMDQKKKELGLLVHDHSRRVIRNPSVSGASGSVETSGAHRIHDGSRLRAPVQRPVQPRCRRDVTPRTRSRSESIGGGTLSPTSKPVGGATRHNRTRRSRQGPASSTSINALINPNPALQPSKDRHPSGTVGLAPTNGLQPNGPSRIPVAPLMRARTAKLSLTLDLSVTNPGDGSRRSQVDKEQLLARRRQAVSDCSYGIAASSGVPPQMSPTGPKETGATPGSVKGKSTPQKTKVPSTPRKARRPSSLQYCLKLNPPKLTAHREEAREPSIAPEAPSGPGSPRTLLAPKATPEDSLIGSCCSSTSEEHSMHTGFMDELERSPGLIGGNSVASRWESRLRLAAAQATVLPGGCRATKTRVVLHPECHHSFHEEPGDSYSEPHFERSSTEFATAGEKLEEDRRSEHCGANQSCGDVFLVPLDGNNFLTTTNLCADSSLTRQLQRLHLSEHPKNDTWELTPLHRCHGDGDGGGGGGGSGNSLPAQSAGGGDMHRRHASIGDTRDLMKESSTASLCPTRSQPSETNTLIADSGSTKRSPTLSMSDGSSDCRLQCRVGAPAAASTPPQPVRSYQSPADSPSCQWTHSRFSHIGSHALDVFFSPEEARSPSEEEQLWRPVLTTMRGSPTERNSSSSSDPFEGDAVGYARAEEGHPSVVLAPLLTSLDVFADDDDLEDCGKATVNKNVSPSQSSLNPRVSNELQADVTRNIRRPIKTSERCGSSIVSLQSSRSLGNPPTGGSTSLSSRGSEDNFAQGLTTLQGAVGSSDRADGGSADHRTGGTANDPPGSVSFDRSCIEEHTDRGRHSGSSLEGSDHQRRHYGDDPGFNSGSCLATSRPTADIPGHSDNGNGSGGKITAGITGAMRSLQETRNVGMATRRRIPVLSNLLRERRVKRDSPDGQKRAEPTTVMTTTTTPVMLTNDYPVEIGTRISSVPSRVPMWRQGLSRLFQMSRTTPATSDRNSNSICHSVEATPFSRNSFKSKVRLANQSDLETNCNETVPMLANHRRLNDVGGASGDYVVPPADSSNFGATPLASVRANNCRRKEGGALLGNAPATTENSVERAESDAILSNSLRTNHCRTIKEGGDNNGNTAVPHVDWSGTDATQVNQQETSLSSSGSVKVSRSSSTKRRSSSTSSYSSRLQGRRLNCDQCTEDDEFNASDNIHLRKVLPASFRCASTSNRDSSKTFPKSRKT